MTSRRQSDEPDWTLGTWDGHDRAQMERWARMSLDEILCAQEEMAALSTELRGELALDQGHSPRSSRSS